MYTDNCRLNSEFLGYPDPRPYRTFANIRYALYEHWLNYYPDNAYILILGTSYTLTHLYTLVHIFYTIYTHIFVLYYTILYYTIFYIIHLYTIHYIIHLYSMYSTLLYYHMLYIYYHMLYI